MLVLHKPWYKPLADSFCLEVHQHLVAVAPIVYIVNFLDVIEKF